MHENLTFESLDELLRRKPHYPNDPELHRLFQCQVTKWQPLIDSIDPSIYSDWEGFFPWSSQDEESRRGVFFMLDNEIVAQSGFTVHRDNGELVKLSSPGSKRNDLETRRKLMQVVIDSYKDFIENRHCDKRWGHAELCIHKPGLRKADVINYFELVAIGGKNPFDIVYAELVGFRHRVEKQQNDVRPISQRISFYSKGDLDYINYFLFDSIIPPFQRSFIENDLKLLLGWYKRHRHLYSGVPLVEGIHPELDKVLRESKSLDDLNRRIKAGKKPFLSRFLRRFFIYVIFILFSLLLGSISERMGCDIGP